MKNEDTDVRTTSIHLKFQPNTDFQKKSLQNESDSAFLGYYRRPWIKQPPAKLDSRRERETLMTLLTSRADEYPIDCVNKLLDEDMRYCDLGSLNNKDLELLGFKQKQQRYELLHLFAELPNQDPSYDSICSLPEAKNYNSQILGNAASHLQAMRASLSSTNYKLQILPPEDVVVGDKRYASRFALEALASVQGLTDELVQNLKQLEDMAIKREQPYDDKKKSCLNLNLYWLSSIALGIALALLMWRINKKTV